MSRTMFLFMFAYIDKPLGSHARWPPKGMKEWMDQREMLNLCVMARRPGTPEMVRKYRPGSMPTVAISNFSGASAKRFRKFGCLWIRCVMWKRF